MNRPSSRLRRWVCAAIVAPATACPSQIASTAFASPAKHERGEQRVALNSGPSRSSGFTTLGPVSTDRHLPVVAGGTQGSVRIHSRFWSDQRGSPQPAWLSELAWKCPIHLVVGVAGPQRVGHPRMLRRTSNIRVRSPSEG